MTDTNPVDAILRNLSSFGLMDALLPRRSRRFCVGAEIPDGVFAYKSRLDPAPLSEPEELLLLAACGAGWHNLIYRARRYAPALSNYSGSATGRTFRSAAGFHTSVTFFTNDRGVFYLDARHAATEN